MTIKERVHAKAITKILGLDREIQRYVNHDYHLTAGLEQGQIDLVIDATVTEMEVWKEILRLNEQGKKQYSFPNEEVYEENQLIEITINGRTLRGAMNRVFDYIKKEYNQ